MLTLIRSAAIAATLSLVPAAGLNSAPVQIDTRPALAVAVSTPQAVRSAVPASVAAFGVEVGHGHDHGSGLAPGQTASDFESWIARSPENFQRVAAFRAFLAAQGLESVVPMWQLTRTSSSWRQCGAEPFEVPPADKWGRIVKTLKFVRDDVVPRIGKVEPLSAYRNQELNACSDGAPKSAHREFFALDLTPVSKGLDRSAMIRQVCDAHAEDGRAYNVGLGFYSGRRFHVDSSGFRKWGPNGKGATSPCLTQA